MKPIVYTLSIATIHIPIGLMILINVSYLDHFTNTKCKDLSSTIIFIQNVLDISYDTYAPNNLHSLIFVL
jgi:hypothetical protein